MRIEIAQNVSAVTLGVIRGYNVRTDLTKQRNVDASGNATPFREWGLWTELIGTTAGAVMQIWMRGRWMEVGEGLFTGGAALLGSRAGTMLAESRESPKPTPGALPAPPAGVTAGMRYQPQRIPAGGQFEQSPTQAVRRRSLNTIY